MKYIQPTRKQMVRSIIFGIFVGIPAGYFSHWMVGFVVGNLGFGFFSTIIIIRQLEERVNNLSTIKDKEV